MHRLAQATILPSSRITYRWLLGSASIRSSDSRVKTMLPESSCIRTDRSTKSEDVYVWSSCIVIINSALICQGPSLHSSITVPDSRRSVLCQRASSTTLKPTTCGKPVEGLRKSYAYRRRGYYAFDSPGKSFLLTSSISKLLANSGRL